MFHVERRTIMPTTYPGIPVLTDGPSGRQIIPLVDRDEDGARIELGYSLRWTPEDEGDNAHPDGVWDAYVCTQDGSADRLVANGVSRHASFEAIRTATR
jgi:hypothetical protein